MKRILFASRENELRFEVEELAQKRGLMLKTSASLEAASNWLKRHSFHLFIVDESFPPAEVNRLLNELWGSNPAAHAMAVVDREIEAEEPTRWELRGLELVHRSQFESEFDAALEKIFDQEDAIRDRFPILVVEDLDSPRDIICIFLESLGFAEVVGMSSASEALKKLEADPEHFACVVTDIRMPHISGKEMIEIIRSHARLRHLPVVVLTAFGTVDTLVECLRAGASGFLVKPPKKADMLRELSRAIRIHQGQLNPRLASYDEAEYIRRHLEEGD